MGLRQGGDWCMRQQGDSTMPPGGQWEIAPRFMQATPDRVPQPGSEWVAWLGDAEHRVRVTHAVPNKKRTRGEDPPAQRWRLLKGYSMVDDTTFNEDNAPQFRCPAVSCAVKVTKAVGCGKTITWSEMAQADPQVVERLGLIDSLEESGSAMQAVGMGLRPELVEFQESANGAYFL